MIECANYCGKPAEKKFTRDVYERPFDKASVKKVFCSEECAETYLHESDFAYFYCDGCSRMVCEQNPDNGWHIQYRVVDCVMVCLKCYEEHILADGIGRGDFEAGLPGMFFSWGNTELTETGYQAVPEFSYYFVKSKESVQAVCKKALELIDKGHKVIVAYEAMAIGGLEGTITLYTKIDKED